MRGLVAAAIPEDLLFRLGKRCKCEYRALEGGASVESVVRVPRVQLRRRKWNVRSGKQRSIEKTRDESTCFLRRRPCEDRCMLPRLANLAKRTPTALRSFRPSPLSFQFPRTMSNSNPAESPAAPAAAVKETPRYALSAVPTEGPVVRTAAMLVIGDEVLNGKLAASATSSNLTAIHRQARPRTPTPTFSPKCSSTWESTSSASRSSATTRRRSSRQYSVWQRTTIS